MWDHRGEFRVKLMSRVLGVSRSGYYAWLRRPQSLRCYRNRQLLVEIRRIHLQSRRSYGSPRVTDELRAEGFMCNEKRVARLMREHGIRAKTVKKFRVTTDSKHNLPVAADLLQREFSAAGADRVWLGDITYVWTSEGWLYLAAVLDLYSRRIVGSAMSRRVDGELTLTALRQALGRRQPPAGLIHHSDQGKQYAAGDYQKLMRHHQLIGSMSRKGDCWDNAPMESFWATLKRELVYQEKFATREEAKMKIFEYIEVFYNCQRRHSSLGSVSPAEFERLTQPTQEQSLCLN
jgi:transposase InsO family protein